MGWQSRTLRYAVSAGVPRRSAVIALVVGTMLNLINQGDALIGSQDISWVKIILTYIVPYCVSTYGAVSFRLSNDEHNLPQAQ